MTAMIRFSETTAFPDGKRRLAHVDGSQLTGKSPIRVVSTSDYAVNRRDDEVNEKDENLMVLTEAVKGLTSLNF